MASDARIEVFQDLVISGPTDQRERLRQVLVKMAVEPWSQAQDNSASSSASPDKDFFIFERSASDDIDPVRLVLYPSDGGYKVTNIVPQKSGELGQHRYNVALRDFHNRVAKPAAAATGFIIEMSSGMQGLDDWLPGSVADELRRFSSCANKSTGSSHPMDRGRWFAFLFAAHRNHGTFDSEYLMRWLIEVEGWYEDVALDLVREYDFAMELLDEYDGIEN